MFNILKKSQHLIQHFFPCQLCGTDQQDQYSICQNCWEQLPWMNQVITKQEISFYIACQYHFPIDRVIQKFKYEHQLHWQNLLTGLILQLPLPKVQAIVPMPISEARLIERGYNQTLEIAKHVGKVLNIPIWQPIERIHQHTQKGLDRFERIENIQNQFKMIKTQKQLRYRRVLILDDVVTTGSSVLALKLKLEQMGCQNVYACAIASTD